MNFLFALQESPLKKYIPDSLKQIGFFLEHWQWLGLLAVIIIGVILDKLTAALFRAGFNRFLKKQDAKVDNETLKKGFKPFGILAMSFFWWFGVNLLGLPETPNKWLLAAAKIVSVISAVWATYRLVDIVSGYMEAKAKKSASKFDDLLVPLLRRSVKIFIFAFGLVFIADNLDIDVSSMLAGLGLGGLAFALAAKDTVSNLFGSLTVLLDRPFQVGDWVIIDGTEGTVEDIAFRTTRLRTFYNSVITLPNAKLITATIDNMGQRKYRRWSTKLGVAYETPPEKIEAVCEGIRELVRVHPYTRKDYFHVYVNEFGPSAVNILLYIFHEAPDWSVELRERHRMMVDILRLCQRLGVVIAYPTQTVYHSPNPTVGETPDLPVLAKIEGAQELGRKEAKSIAEGELGGLDQKPGKVTF